MKMALFKDSCLMIIAWCVYLNGYSFMAMVLALLSSIYLLVIKSEVNYWRIAAIALGIYVVSESILRFSNIPYFFPDLKYFMIFTSLNCSLANEYLYMIKYKFIFPVLIIIILYVVLLSLVICMLEEASYTMFGKKNLYLMVMFIFFPYLSVMACACFSKNKAVLSKKWRLN